MLKKIKHHLILMFHKRYISFDHKMRTWLFTVCCGLMPIAIRFLVASGAPKQDLPYVALSDIAFLGIMFNTAAVANFSASKWIGREVYSSVLFISIILVMVLIAIHTVSGLPGHTSVILWIVTAFVLVASFFFSLLSTSDVFIHASQTTLRYADILADRHPFLQEFIIEQHRRAVDDPIPEDGKLPDIREEFEHFLTKKGVPLDESSQITGQS